MSSDPTKMTTAELRRAAEQYKVSMLEAGEGFNPYSAELERRELAARKPKPRSESDVLHDIERLDHTAVREGRPDAVAEYEALRRELAELREAREAAFWSEWTPEVFAARRAAWNAEIQKVGRWVDAQTLAAIQRRLGFSFDDLKKAKARYA